MRKYAMSCCLVVLSAALSVGSLRAELKQLSSEVDVSGRIADMAQTTHSSGYNFNVGLTGLKYRGRVDRTLLEKKDAGELTVWLALRDVVLTIDRTSITGRPGRATCGPLQIQLGHRRDLWVAFDFETAANDDASGLRLKNTRFAIPNDNWAIGSPAWVQTSGFGMSRSKVTNGLRSGLLNNKQRIEQRLIEIAPTILANVAPVPDNKPANRKSIAPAVHRKLLDGGHLIIKPSDRMDVADIAG